MDSMKLHSNAALTPARRQKLYQRYATGQISYTQLANEFGVSRKTAIKWANRTQVQDASSAPKTHATRVTPAYRQAVIDYRTAQPTHGPVRIERQLRAQFGHFSPSTVRLILQAHKAPSVPRPKAPPLPTGRFRTQMDVQQLPAVKGQKGFAYKISIIHLATRMKYSEIHDNQQSDTLAEVFKRSMEVLPPFLSPLPIMP